MKKGITLFLSIFILFQPLFSKPYIAIPGSKDKVDTEATIQGLLEVKQFPITAKENDIKDYEIENRIIEDFGKYVKKLDDDTKALYNIKSPFREMVGESSDVEIIEATADRNAIKKDYKVKVLQIAQSDSFMSIPIPRNQRLSPANFSIKIGEDIYQIRFTGGTIHQLALAIREQSDGKIDTRVMNDTSTTSVLQVSGTVTGAKYKMQFEGDLTPLFETELLTKTISQTISKKIDFQPTISYSTNRLQASANQIILVPLSKGELNLESQQINISNTTYFTWSGDVQHQTAPVTPTLSNKPAVSLNIGKMEDVTVSNIIVEGGTLIPFYQKKSPVKVVEIVSNNNEVFSLIFHDGSSQTFSVISNGTFRFNMITWTGKKLSKILFQNLNTYDKYRLTDFTFVTPVDDGGLRPKKYLSKACDSIFTIDGVQIIRDKNSVEDVIDGLVIYLKKASDKEVDLKIDHNYKLVMDSILEWVNTYNQVMEYLSIITKPNLDRTPLHEKAEKDQKIGLYQAESSFTSLHNKLRLAVMNSYQTDYGRELALMDQIGIFTKEAGSFNASSDVWESTRMGLLNVDADKLNNKLVTQFDGVKQLFANAKDGSFTGVGWEINQTLRLPLGAAGFLNNKQKNNENKIKDMKKTVAKLKEDLKDYEMQLRIQYGKLNQTINQTDKQKEYWNNVNKNN